MSVPNWAVALTIELIILLLLVAVFLGLGWRLSSRKKQRQLDKLLAQLNQPGRPPDAQAERQPTAAQKPVKQQAQEPADTTAKQPKNDCQALQEEIELLKIQLQQAQENPFLQEKIDALTAENEDLQTQLSAYRPPQ